MRTFARMTGVAAPPVVARLLRGSLVCLGMLAGGCLATGPANAMDEIMVERVCPYDGVKFKFGEILSGSSIDQQLDMKPKGMIAAPWPMAECPTNGFLFFKEEFDADELNHLRPLILSAEYQGLRAETPYYRVAWIKERMGAPHQEISDWLFQATWEAESKQYNRYATELVARLPEDIANITDNAAERIGKRMLLGELLRRLGRFEEADSHFAALMQDLASGSRELKIVEFQRKLIASKDSGIHLVSEAVGRKQGAE